MPVLGRLPGLLGSYGCCWLNPQSGPVAACQSCPPQSRSNPQQIPSASVSQSCAVEKHAARGLGVCIRVAVAGVQPADIQTGFLASLPGRSPSQRFVGDPGEGGGSPFAWLNIPVCSSPAAAGNDKEKNLGCSAAARVKTEKALGSQTRRSSSEQDSYVWDHTSLLQRELTTAQKQPKNHPGNPPILPACVPRNPLQGSPGRIQTWASPLSFVPLPFKAGQEPLLLLSARSQPSASPLPPGTAVQLAALHVCVFASEGVPLALCYDTQTHTLEVISRCAAGEEKAETVSRHSP
ncbi:hypothetical protein Q8A73_021857 [Channa argus]|nr:hypothetical protein Q8A73_021857 [Channa argus]